MVKNGSIFKAYNNFDIGKYKTKIILYFATIINLLLEIFSLSLIIPIVGVILDYTDIQ